MREISLNGEWDFVADLDPRYHLDTRIYPQPEYASPDADRRDWRKVPVPGVWQKYAERYEVFEGVCWFARQFPVDSLGEGAAARLRFGAVNYLCRVFLNGQEIGGHEGGYTEFTLDATGRLRQGTNHIAVMADNRAAVIKWPPVLGYFNYGGIHRDVRLEIFDGAGIGEVHVIAAAVDGGGRLTVTGRVANFAGPVSVTIHCAGREATVEAPLAAFRCRLEVPGVEPWAPRSPRLYPVEISLRQGGKLLDRRELLCGFRTIEMKDGRVRLNAAPIALQGICYVYDSPETGLVMTDRQIGSDVAMMKELGCNAVRCHYPMDERFYSACDRAGLLVWIEPPVYCYHPRDDERGTAFADPDWRRAAEQTIDEMIATARNHPSVAIYGIGNECNTANPEAEEFFRALAVRVALGDGAGLTSYAALYGNVGPLAGLVDVLGVNSYWGWYDKVFGGKGAAPGDGAREPIDLTEMRQMLDRLLAGRPRLALLLTEFGADSVAGFRSPARELWSEDYHADLLREIFALAREYPAVAGTFPFCFADYRDPSKVHNGFWNELNLKGLVDYHRRKKLAFGAVRDQYGGK
ncbi:MAG TPA: glycoside hydrolase family 2 TIM barrel-domain containing protein [Phycisphaerae bacterium]|nr:glycoside hydrolase family 2 TIM barrel-domain containing protein [Phycisphaerae bacterium]